ncbi:MAG: DUF6261 family protein [Saprospiraceae bacterium]
MKKLKTATLSSYRSGEFLQFMKNVVSVYQTHNAPSLGLEKRLSTLQLSLVELDIVFVNATGHKITGVLKELSSKRSKTVTGLRSYLESQQLFEDPTKAKAANLIMANFRMHCGNLKKASNQEKTALINAMIHDWTSEVPLQEAVVALDLQAWIKPLEALNNEFDEQHVMRSRTALPLIKSNEKKKVIRAAYLELVKDTESFARVSPDNLVYELIIKDLNGLTDDYNKPVSLRSVVSKKAPIVVQKEDTPIF